MKIQLKLPLCALLAASAAMKVSAAHAQDGSNSLFICDNGDGTTRIVSAAQQSGKCEPYRKGMFGSGGVSTAPSVALNPHSPHILTADPKHGLNTPAANPVRAAHRPPPRSAAQRSASARWAQLAAG